MHDEVLIQHGEPPPMRRGLQAMPDGTTRELFHDPLTGVTFGVGSDETIEQAQRRSRENWNRRIMLAGF